MPNDNNDDDLKNLSIEEINDLFSDIIEFPIDIESDYLIIGLAGQRTVFNSDLREETYQVCYGTRGSGFGK